MGIDPKLIMLRGQLDKIDEQIISLFGERRAVIQNVAQFKKREEGSLFLTLKGKKKCFTV